MRMLKKAAIATVAAGSLSILGAGPAMAADSNGPDVEVKNTLSQSQSCTYKALVPINVAVLAFDASQGNLTCVQEGSIG